MQDLLEPILKTDKLSDEELDALNQRFEESHPSEILAWGYETFGRDMVLGTGFGSSGVFLIHQLQTHGIDTPIFYLDTNLLFDSTYELKDTIEARYNISIPELPPNFLWQNKQNGLGMNSGNGIPINAAFTGKYFHFGIIYLIKKRG